MARKYSKSASKDVKGAMHKKKRGTLKSVVSFSGAAWSLRRLLQNDAQRHEETRHKGAAVSTQNVSFGIDNPIFVGKELPGSHAWLRIKLLGAVLF